MTREEFTMARQSDSPTTASLRASAVVATPLSRADEAIAVAFVDRLHRQFGDRLLEVILFGSHARGDAGPESDYDMFVVLDVAASAYRACWRDAVRIAWDVELAHDVAISLVLKRADDVARMRRGGALLTRIVADEGVPLWNQTACVPISAFA
jgi:predicted nucleotidyltransferase